MAVAPRPWQTPQLPVPSRQSKRPARNSRTPKIVAAPVQPIFKPNPTPSPVRSVIAPSSKQTNSKQTSSKPQTVIRPAAQAVPRTSIQVKLFSMGQRFTQFLAIASVATAVGLYASTVHSQKVWGEEFEKLVQLQDHENRFVAVSESIKEQAIEQIDQVPVPLVTPTPQQTLYVPIPKAVQLRPETPPRITPIDNQAPIGY